MNICYLIDVAPGRMNGGGQVHLLNLVRALQLRITNYELRIFGASRSNLIFRFGWMLLVIPQVFFHHFFFRRFDLIHSHSIPAMIPAKVLSLLLGVPVVVTVHGSILNMTHPLVIPRSTRNLYRFLTRFAGALARRVKSGMTMKKVFEKIILTKVHYDAQITVSRDFMKIQNHNKNVVYIPNGVDLVRFSSHQSLITNHQSPVILFVGRKNDPIKGFSVLHEAMRLVKKQFPTVRLIVADGSVPSLRLPHLYQSSNLLVIPSLSEGFPLTLLEAWASKLPVVATAVGEIPYLVKDDINGFLVSSHDVRQLANGIFRALRYKNLAKIAENGYNAAKHYSWKKVATQTYSIYQQILHEVPFTNH